ncbi:uncharacterized protein PFL1_02652 [Pseudozyma flocculosa PF-1]|uniref:Uncharacterized protein n=2 Tax=Pseudozyma flocculosa TaxID=84751 RepID=A0A5C3EZR1_9BASI|nr:uncharacterized protein PFL1_02652 [Pseudozyma flocculosa PF-1]EPQ29979.1 hypothetical protein PFL1_02652 [Pseudozyma flocculosa PF-1]SPO37295.1 uncharacterized protein PSFLO_02768 [Pseudozyma flocculosa]
MASSIPSHLVHSGGGGGRQRSSNSFGSLSGSGSRNGGLGSRHASHATLKEDAINDWLSTSDAAAMPDRMPATPTGPCDIDTFIVHDELGGGDSIGLMDDVVSPAVRWNAILESAGGGGGADDGFAKGWGDADLEFKASTLIANLHVDDFFHDNASSAGSSYGGGVGVGAGCHGTLNLPGWNNGPSDFHHGALDSDADSPDGVWCAQGRLPSRSLRRSAKLNSMISVDALQESYGSPGAGLGLVAVNSPSPPASTMQPMAAVHAVSASSPLLAPPRMLRQCSSAPQLQRDDDEMLEPASFLAGPRFSNESGTAAARPASRFTTAADLLGTSGSMCAGTQNPTISISLATASGGGAQPGSGSQPSALFQRRAVQREGHMPAPSPVNVDTAQAQSQSQTSSLAAAQGQENQAQSQGEAQTPAFDIPLSELTAADLEKMTEEQRLKLAQLHQLHVAQQAARLGVYSDFVAPSQQFAGQEASERAAKAVQAALLYGMEGNGPRRLSVGSTGLPTPITPQHPLNPGPGQPGYGLVGHPYLSQYAMPQQHYRMGGSAVGGRMPGMPMSAIETSFPPSIYYPQHSYHHHQQQQQHQSMFTPQYLQQQQQHHHQQHGGGVFMTQQVSQDMAGYTSTYPPPREDASMPAETSTGATTGSGGRAVGSDVFERTMPHSAPGDLASEIAANPMQLQMPYTMQTQPHQQQSQPQQQQQQAAVEVGVTPVELHQPVPQRPLLTQYHHQGSMSFPSSDAQPHHYHHHHQQQSQGQQQQQQPSFQQMSQIEPRSAPAGIESSQLSMQQQQQQQHTLLLLQQQQRQQSEERRRQLQSKASMPAITSRKHQPAQLSAPLSPPRSPTKMKSSPQLRGSTTPPAGGGGGGGSNASSTSSKSPSIRKIASNKRINAGIGGGAGSSSSSSSVPVASAGATSTKSLGKARSMMLDSSSGITAASPSPSAASSSRRLRTMSHASLASSSSKGGGGGGGSSWKSKSPTPTPGGGGSFNFSSLSFVNYGMDDADELCSAVAPSGSYKVPLKGYGSSGSESRSDDEDDDETVAGGGDRDEVGGGGGDSPVKKARTASSRSRSRTVSRAESLGNLRTKRSQAAFPAELRNDPRVRERSESVASRR